MTERPMGSTVPRRQLGRYLRDLRNRSRLTVRAAADKLEWSDAKIWRIETGQTALRSHDVEAMCKVYGAPPDLTGALMGLAKETKARGWWHSYGDVIPEWFDVYIGLEEAASRLTWYESDLVPGLLQTEDYARAVIRADNPGVADEEIERRVRLRCDRQVLVTRTTDPPALDVVLSEAVLRRPVGAEGVMTDQLDRLVRAGDLPHVSIRVVPFEAGVHPGIMSGPFAILRFPTNGDGRDTEPPIVYVEGFTGALYLDKPHEIDRYGTAFIDIWAAAASEPASKHIRDHIAGHQADTARGVSMQVIEVKQGELIESIARQAKDAGIANAAIVSLIGAVDSFTVSTMPAGDASTDVLTDYAMPAEMSGTGEIVDGAVHIHAVLAVEGDRAISGHLHRAEVGHWFARAHLLRHSTRSPSTSETASPSTRTRPCGFGESRG